MRGVATSARRLPAPGDRNQAHSSVRRSDLECQKGLSLVNPCPKTPFQSLPSLFSLDREHAATTELGGRSPPRFSTPFARWTVERNSVMQHSVVMTVFHAREFFVVVPNWAETFLNGSMLYRTIRMSANFLRGLHRFAKEATRNGKFSLVEHRHFTVASPAPEPLHASMIHGKERTGKPTPRTEGLESGPSTADRASPQKCP